MLGSIGSDWVVAVTGLSVKTFFRIEVSLPRVRLFRLLRLRRLRDVELVIDTIHERRQENVPPLRGVWWILESDTVIRVPKEPNLVLDQT